MTRIITKEETYLKEMMELVKKQASKKFNYKIQDFSIKKSPEGEYIWQRKDWNNTWCIGDKSKEKTNAMVNQYISECKKPIMKRDFSFMHLYHD